MLFCHITISLGSVTQSERITYILIAAELRLEQVIVFLPALIVYE